MNLQHVLTIFCVLHSPVCTDEDEEHIKSSCQKMLQEGEKLTKEDFISTPMWIDTYESCATPPGYEIYNRVEKLKEIIFHINKDDEFLMLQILTKARSLLRCQVSTSNGIVYATNQ